MYIQTKKKKNWWNRSAVQYLYRCLECVPWVGHCKRCIKFEFSDKLLYTRKNTILSGDGLSAYTYNIMLWIYDILKMLLKYLTYFTVYIGWINISRKPWVHHKTILFYLILLVSSCYSLVQLKFYTDCRTMRGF